jgi:mono/diheme cytochrome c family protein
LRPDDPQVLRVGARIYAQQCAACHGAKGEGQPDWRDRGPDGLLPAPPHDASGHTWHHPDEQLFAITKQGLAQLINQPDYRTAMPIYGGVLSDDEIVAVLSWIKAQWPPRYGSATMRSMSSTASPLSQALLHKCRSQLR